MRADALPPSDGDLIAEHAALRGRVAALPQRVVELEAVLKTALEHLGAARRAGKRQAAPFSKGPPKEQPQRPGQKAGHPAVHREQPPPVQRTLEVTLAHVTCLTCGGTLVDHTIQVQ